MESILIIDDDNGIRRQLKWGLDKDYKTLLAEDGSQAIELFKKHKPMVVTLDLGLPPDADGASEGLRVLEEILAEGKNTKVIVVSGNEEHKNALTAIGMGAYDYCQKPIDLGYPEGYSLQSLSSGKPGSGKSPLQATKIKWPGNHGGNVRPVPADGGDFFNHPQGGVD